MTKTLRAVAAALVLSTTGVPVHAAGATSGGAAPGSLVGAWKLTAAYADSNRNSRLDADERQAPVQGVQDYLKLNADGTCEFYVFKVRGRYELQPRSDGSRKLILTDKDGKKEDRGLVVSVSGDELVLMNFSTRMFSVYARQP